MQTHTRSMRPLLTTTQIHRLLEAARGHDLETFLELAVATAMRRGELLALRWHDLDLPTRTLTVSRTLTPFCTKETYSLPKYGMQRIALTPYACTVLEQHRERQGHVKQHASTVWQEHDLVFCTTAGAHLDFSRDIQASFQALVSAAALPSIHFHDVRSSLIVNAGKGQKEHIS